MNWIAESEEYKYRATRWQIWWQGTIKETENKSGYLENNPVFDWQPVKCFEQWSNMFTSALVEKKLNFYCLVLNFLQPVHLSMSKKLQ